MNKVTTITDKTFKQEVLESDTPVLVDFWASWCPPCKMTEPVVKELAQELCDVMKIVKINTDQNPKSAVDYNIMGVPTFIFFRDGKEIERRVGAQSKQQLMDMIGGCRSKL
ncbi:thioredoxin [Candidatus Omnitrophota bacterium]